VGAVHQCIRDVAIASLASALLARPSAAQAAASVAIVGNDYAFVEFPKTIAAGSTALSFENRGKVRHEMSVVLLRPGVTMQDVLQRGPGAASSKAMAEKIIGILIARPGESAGGKLLVDLESGRRYLVVCTLKDMPDAKPHVELGMVASFDVP
jgi:hypothetical protein